MSELSKKYYFTDGAISQYKNNKNMCVYHREDFNLEAEWLVFATSHGKNACNGIGGTLKREGRKIEPESYNNLPHYYS